MVLYFLAAGDQDETNSLAYLLWSLPGCGTQYQRMGFSGGVEAQQVTADTFRIIARGNGFTKGTTIQDYVLLKAAETTKKMGGTHFIVVNSADATKSDYITTPGHATTTFVGKTAHSTYSPGQSHRVTKPGKDAYIRVLNIPPGGSPPRSAMAVDEIIQYVGSRVKRG